MRTVDTGIAAFGFAVAVPARGLDRGVGAGRPLHVQADAATRVPSASPSPEVRDGPGPRHGVVTGAEFQGAEGASSPRRRR